MSCRSAQKVAAAQAQKERQYIRELQGRYGDSTVIAFPISFPGGMLVKEIKAPCPDFDSGTVVSNAGVLKIVLPCPPVSVNADSIIRNSIAYKAAIVARRGADMAADSAVRSVIKFEVMASQVKKERDAYRIGFFVMLIAGLFVLIVKLKK